MTVNKQPCSLRSSRVTLTTHTTSIRSVNLYALILTPALSVRVLYRSNIQYSWPGIQFVKNLGKDQEDREMWWQVLGEKKKKADLGTFQAKPSASCTVMLDLLRTLATRSLRISRRENLSSASFEIWHWSTERTCYFYLFLFLCVCVCVTIALKLLVFSPFFKPDVDVFFFFFPPPTNISFFFRFIELPVKCVCFFLCNVWKP